MMDDIDYLAHFGVKGMKWGIRKKSNLNNSSKKRISRKEYRDIVKKNKKALQSRKYQALKAYYSGDKKAQAIEKKYARQAIANINDARIKRGKKAVKSVLYNLPGTLVGRDYI